MLTHNNYLGCENMKVTHAKARVPCLNQLYQSFSGKISKRKYAKYCPPLMLRKWEQ